MLGSAISSYLVCKRTTKGQLGVGIKTSMASWLFSLFLMISFAEELNTALIMALLVCYLAGGVAGAYITLKARLKKPPEKPEPKPEAEV